MSWKYVGAVDQGTTSGRFILFDHKGEIAAYHQLEHKQIFPQAGWVEHDALEIWHSIETAIRETLQKANISRGEIAAIGITNQRETTVVWNKRTGKPYTNAIVWQDTRTAPICDELAKEGGKDRFRDKTGLPLATYFSGPKLKWLLDHNAEIKQAAARGEALFGTIDTWLIWNLTGGPQGGIHATDVTNASRTMLMNLKTLNWDKELLKTFSIPESILPSINPSVHTKAYGSTSPEGPFKEPILIGGDLGDQHAALFGQTCFSPGEAKNTYGTGCFLLLNTGTELVHSRAGLITTVGYQLENNPVVYALEGSVAVAGALVQWARDKLGMIQNAPEIDILAASVPDNGGAYFVPAFSGLFAPYWRSDARGVITGLTHNTDKRHIARAILEATAYQTREVFDAMAKDSGIKLAALKVDGGMVKSELLMQFQADLLNVPVERPRVAETTALGAAYAAGLAAGFWKSLDDLRKNWIKSKEWLPEMDSFRSNSYYQQWLKAVQKSLGWIE